MAAEALDFTTQAVSEGFETLEADSHAEDGKNAGIEPVACETDPGSTTKLIIDSTRAEINMSVPFLSVKEAANRFGGMGFWRRPSHKLSECEFEAFDITLVEEQAVQLKKVLMKKERETLDVLKELETAKMNVEELKLKLQKEASECENVSPSLEVAEEKENHNKLADDIYNSNDVFSLSPSSVLGFILMELKQAKLNLTRTSDLSDIRATVQTISKKIETESLALEMVSRRRLSLKSSRISSLEEEVNKTRLMLQMAQDCDIKDDSNNPTEISGELQQLSLNDDFKPVLGPKLSIGKILSRKLFLTEVFGNEMKFKKEGAVKRKMSFRQMFSRPNHETLFTGKAESETGHNQMPVKRKKFRFPWFCVLERQ